MARMDWLFGKRRPRPSAESVEEILSREARGISEHFRGIGGSSVRLGVEIPLPKVEIDRVQVNDFNDLAKEMAEAQRRAHLAAQVANEMRRGADAISKSKVKTEETFRKAEEDLNKAYEILGLTPP